jgi:WD40 repeat protein
VQIWERAGWKKRAELRVGPVLAFAPDGKVLATAGPGRQVTLWDVVTGQQRAALPVDVGQFRGLAFSPDGSALAASGDQGLWRAARPDEMAGHERTRLFAR